MAKIYLGLGSNVEPQKYLRQGIRELGRRFGVLELSNVYRSKALGFDGADFLSDIEVNDRGELWVLDRGINRPGARVFRASDATEITSAPINLGLPPFQVIFLRNTL